MVQRGVRLLLRHHQRHDGRQRQLHRGAAFGSCFGLTSMTISPRVSSIGDFAFGNCYSPTNVYFNGNAANAAWWNVVLNVHRRSITCRASTAGVF
jgi:hypothetical protein